MRGGLQHILLGPNDVATFDRRFHLIEQGEEVVARAKAFHGANMATLQGAAQPS